MSSTPSAIDNWGNLLQRALDEIGLSQNRLAELLDTPQPTINRWCRGINKPAPTVQVRVFEALRDQGWPGSITSLFPRTDDEADLAVRCTGTH